ncbi:hypothetical protein NW762_012493 [Fusarium torreyae]|uniref:BTB domain-containing protein n=1 Tax=Fusarium torreyae TaxID=1237075 RepID=A0A9W8RQN3_9HYPO|nr:hypothetical protein NW762_012493 [Fusarium torreyae]
MTILYENIDPDGDVLIIIPYATGNCQSADEPEAIDESRAVVETDARAGPEASVEPKAPSEPVAADELVATNEPTSAEVDSVEESLSELRFKVSKKHLTIASQRARTMFKSKCKETQKSEVDGLYHWTIEPMFDPEALRIVLRIIHAQAQHLPNHVPLEMIVSIAEVADDLRCHEALSFFVEVWIDRLSQSVPNQMCSELVQWIFIASVFGLDEKFKQASRVAIMHSTGPIDVSGLPMRPEISGLNKRDRIFSMT